MPAHLYRKLAQDTHAAVFAVGREDVDSFDVVIRRRRNADDDDDDQRQKENLVVHLFKLLRGPDKNTLRARLIFLSSSI